MMKIENQSYAIPLIGMTDPCVRVFLCFYLAIFQLTNAKFQTFAYKVCG